MSKRFGIGNVHTHHLDLMCLPEHLSKQQSGLPEWLDVIATRIFRGLFNENVRRFLDVMTKEKKDYIQVSRYHLEDMNKADIDYSVVLHIDAEGSDPAAQDKNYQYEYVIDKIAQACALRPFRWFPFFGFDPRRPNVQKMLKTNFEDRCYVGIKLYPAMGFDPRPNRQSYTLKNRDYFKHEYQGYPEGGLLQGDEILANLQFLYEFAKTRQIPILTHCSVNGSYQVTVDKDEKYKDIWRYSNPENFAPVAKKFELRICFAHMGGHIDELENQSKAIAWYDKIRILIKEADGWEGSGRLYTDQAYGIIHLLKDDKKKRALDSNIGKTIKYLDDDVLGRYMLFGSDWPLNIYKATEKEYIDEYRARLTAAQQRRYFSKNIARFLFGETGRIPDNYVDYIKNRCKKEDRPFSLPDWIEKKGDSYFLLS